MDKIDKKDTAVSTKDTAAQKVDTAVPMVEMKGIVKRFGDFTALHGVDFTLHKGEVHALLGENGAGKTTLMNILYGMFPPTQGEIRIRGKSYSRLTPKEAIQNGIGMVHQHFMLVNTFTVTENIVLGTEIVKHGVFLDMAAARQKVIELSERYGLTIHPDDKVEDITVGMQQRIEILKALYRGADIFIFDEPTAVLTPQEIEEFIHIVRNLTKEGKCAVIITHKLSEIRQMADYCTIIRRGEYIDKLDVSQVDENDLAEKMVGRKVSFNVDKKAQEAGESVLLVDNLVVEDNRGLDALKGFSLEVKRGEILGIAGVDGNGQSQLIEALTGLRKIKSGKITFNGKDITGAPARHIIDQGLSCIPEDRQRRGLVLDFKIFENMILENYGKVPYCKNGILQFHTIKTRTDEMVKKFDIRPTNIEAAARDLSGGNQQKVILAREIDNDPELLIAAQPTRGLDVGAIEFIHQYLVEQRNKNKAVLLVSFELDEVMDLSDRIAVIHDGHIVGIRKPGETDEKELGILMAGGTVHEKIQ